jgi:hypothetical protein
MKNSVIVIVLASILASGCATMQTPKIEEASPQALFISLDDQLVTVAKLVPGFGGMFFDDNGNLNVYMVKPDEELSAQARQERKARLEAVLTAVFGEDFLSQGKGQHPGLRKETPPEQPPQIRIIKGAYDILQLAKWRASVDKALDVPGAVFTDLDEKKNRLRIGIESSIFRKRVHEVLTQQGVPPEAVIIEETKPIRFHDTLRDKIRPLQGGVQVEADTGVFAFALCTMGFNATHNSKKGFVTNSHCTRIQGGSEGTDFHQPTDPLNPFVSQNKVGDEIFDPEYWTASICPSGRVCRTSDSAFVEYDSAEFFGTRIARTSSFGSLTISSTNPTFTIIDETLFPISGVALNKVGRTTGWTSGTLTSGTSSGTCMNINVADTDITLLCQYTVTNTGTDKISDLGDSGSPVFRWLGNNEVNLYGILWGGTDDGSVFAFSSMLFLHLELFPLTAVNFPAPPPPSPRPIGCPIDEKCCEKAPNGDCVLCIPRTAACP